VLRSRKHVASVHPGLTAKLTPSKLRALDVLAEGGLRIGELAGRVGVDDTTATRLVDRIESMGLVARRSDASDRRATAVALTPAGEELVAGLAAQRQLLGALEPDECSELVRLTAKAAEALRARSQEPVSG
jgi:DNA-binding MarR family transcriptional regulator